MNTRMIKIAIAAAALVTVPMISSAANSPASVDSCVKAFMTMLSSKNSGVKLREARYLDNGSVAASNELTLTARDVHDNRPVARAVCTADAAGQVLDVREEPVASFSLE